MDDLQDPAKLRLWSVSWYREPDNDPLVTSDDDVVVVVGLAVVVVVHGQSHPPVTPPGKFEMARAWTDEARTTTRRIASRPSASVLEMVCFGPDPRFPVLLIMPPMQRAGPKRQ
jgi:hypothetical protein